MAAMGVTLVGDPVEVRALLASFPRPEGEPVGSVEDRTIDVGGASIPVRIYKLANASGTLPVLVWYHGGGWVIGNLDGADFACRMLTNASGAAVVSVDYRLAPEHRFPAAADDCFAATKWVVEHASELGVDGSRLAVGGDSAGGNLAAVVCQMAKKAGGPAIRLQVLIYPVTDYSFATTSYTENADGYLLTRESMEWFWGHYLGDDDGSHPKASPLREADLAGLPPAVVVTAEFDPLRDEGEAYAKRLREAGVKVEAKRYDGQIHGFFANPLIDDGKEAAVKAGHAVRDSFALATSR
jgi:acetyl esterase